MLKRSVYVVGKVENMTSTDDDVEKLEDQPCLRLGEIGPEQECSDVTEFSGHSDFPEL